MVRTLFPNEWVELRELVLPEQGVKGYVYSHEKRCHGHIVAVLPYRMDSDGNLEEVMVRQEVTPCWGMKPVMSSITGGVEKDADGELDPLGTAALELREEGGLSVDLSELKSLGICRGTKSTDTVYHLYAADAADALEVEATGDGSRLESLVKCIWVKPERLKDAMDPLLAMLFVRLVFR